MLGERRLLEFLVPIVHPDKPTWVIPTLGNTVFGALGRKRPVDWAKIFVELVNWLVGAAGKTKPIPICPFLFHLYESKGLLTKDEETDYQAAEELTQYQITSDRDPESESEVLRITGPAPPHVAAPVNQVKRGNQRKQTYRAPDGSPLVRSRGEGSRPNSGSPQSEGAQPRSPHLASPPPQQPQPGPQPEPQQPVEEEKPQIRKPFNAIVESYRVVKEQYQSLECILDSISLYFDVEPRYLLDHIQGLLKHQELKDLQARVDCLLKENGELKAKMEEGQALQKEMDKLRNWIASVEEEAKIARAEWDKAKTVAQKIHGYLGFPSDVLNKARLYDHGPKQPTTDSSVKMMQCMVDYGLKLEKTLKELRALLHPTGAQPEPVEPQALGQA